MNQNCWNGAGRLTSDAEFNTTRKGTSMSKFRLAVNDHRNDDTLFINVLCFGKMAENLNPMLLRGRCVAITGKLKIDNYEDEEKKQEKFRLYYGRRYLPRSRSITDHTKG